MKTSYDYIVGIEEKEQPPKRVYSNKWSHPTRLRLVDLIQKADGEKWYCVTVKAESAEEAVHQARNIIANIRRMAEGHDVSLAAVTTLPDDAEEDVPVRNVWFKATEKE